jgi:hypothetical protein
MSKGPSLLDILFIDWQEEPDLATSYPTSYSTGKQSFLLYLYG